MPDADDLRAYGWAPRFYMIYCSRCEKPADNAAKRAWRCEPCARAAKEAADGRR